MDNRSTTKQPAIMATSAMKIMPPSLDLMRVRKRKMMPAFSTAESTASPTLGLRIFGDVVVAATVTLGISPFLTVIDKSIVQRAAGTHTMAQSCFESVRTMARNPAAYVKSPAFLMMWGVYAATYSTANCIKTFGEYQDVQCRQQRQHRSIRPINDGPDAGGSSGKMGVFFGTSVVNSSLSLLKDRAYATMFSSGAGAAPKVPLVTYGLWASRDFMVIGSSFVLPEKVSRELVDRTGMDRSDALKLAQFACPVATQFLAGPVQLLGLDYYNRPLAHLSTGEAALERVLCLWKGAASVIGARVARIAPGYGIGGIGNTHLRDAWREMLVRREDKVLADAEVRRKGLTMV